MKILLSAFAFFNLSFCTYSLATQAVTGELKVYNSRPLQAESTADSLIPFETPISGFFIRSHHDVPDIQGNDWDITIDGLVENPIHLRLSDLEKMPQVSQYAVLECSGNGRGLQSPKVPGIPWTKGAVGNGYWTGVQLKEILNKAKIKTDAKFVRVEGADTPAIATVPPFVRSIPIAKIQDEKTILALKLNRETLPVLHGGPVRLILPGWYGQNWIKWVKKLTLVAEPDPGFYSKKAYRMPTKPVGPKDTWDSTTGKPIEELLVQSFVVSPKENERVKRGNFTIEGKAFSGAGTIEAVDISLDQGKTWKPAVVEKPHAEGGWQKFTYAASALKTGLLKIQTRAKDTQGNSQPKAHVWNPGGYLRNAIATHSIQIVSEQLATARELFETKCLTCHTEGMITSQDLTKETWPKVLKKMETFGAQLSEKEKEILLFYLTHQGSN